MLLKDLKFKCKHKWAIPLMYNPKNIFNPTECIKCGELTLNVPFKSKFKK